VRDLRQRFAAAIVIVSGHAEVADDGKLLGADGILMKPFEIDSLLATLRAAAGANRA
jgi:DNA-binding response OmpR family regulator